MTDRNELESTENTDSGNHSRRGFLSKSAVAGGALLALGGGAGVALADEHPMPDMEASFDDVEGTDIDVLNYALSLEHLEAAFYQTALETFDEQAFVDAESLSAYSEEQRQQAYGYVETLAEQEAEHVDVLTQTVELLGGDPVVAAEYEFGFEEVSEFLSLASTIEDTGVAAYAGAAPYIESPDLLGALLSIHSVEARHAAAMSVFSGSSPFPAAFDEASSQSDVMDVVGQFVVGAEGEGEDEEDETEEEETETEEGEATETEGEATETEAAEGEATETEAAEGEATETETGNETVTEAGNETVTEAGNETATDAS